MIDYTEREGEEERYYSNAAAVSLQVVDIIAAFYLKCGGGLRQEGGMRL